MTLPELYKTMAKALPYELQSALLAVRDTDDLNRTVANMPDDTYFGLLALGLISELGGVVALTKVGSRLVNYCTC